MPTGSAVLTPARRIAISRPVAVPKAAIVAGNVCSGAEAHAQSNSKLLLEVGGRPLLWHVMMQLSQGGLTNFAIAIDDRADPIKRYMLDAPGVQTTPRYDWTVDLIDTGSVETFFGRLKRLWPSLGDSTFILTDGASLSDIDLDDLRGFHRTHGRLATAMAVRPPARFGRLQLDGDQVLDFAEKPQLEQGWINSGLFLLEPAVFDYIDGEDTQWERQILQRLATDGELMAYQHDSFWQRLDTLRDLRLLEDLWQSGNAPWKSWY